MTWGALALGFLWLAASPAAADPAADPAAERAVAEARATVGSMFERIGAVVGDPGATPEAKRALVERELRAHLDQGALAAAALGALAQQFSHQQYAAFAQAYARFLEDALVRRIASGAPGPLEIVGATYDPERSEVRIEAHGPPRQTLVPGATALGRAPRVEVVPVRLSLRSRHGEWRVRGIGLGDVDLSRLYREQFAAVLERADPDALVETLRARNRESGAENPFAAAPATGSAAP